MVVPATTEIYLQPEGYFVITLIILIVALSIINFQTFILIMKFISFSKLFCYCILSVVMYMYVYMYVYMYISCIYVCINKEIIMIIILAIILVFSISHYISNNNR